MPQYLVEAHTRVLPGLIASDDLRMVTNISFPHWSGSSSDHKQAAREAAKLRKDYIRSLNLRVARGDQSRLPGVQIIKGGASLRNWLGSWDIDAT